MTSQRIQRQVPINASFRFVNAAASPALLLAANNSPLITWPREIGTRPWEAKLEQYVKRQDYVPGGMVAAAPGGGEWFRVVPHSPWFDASPGRIARTAGLTPAHPGVECGNP